MISPMVFTIMRHFVHGLGSSTFMPSAVDMELLTSASVPVPESTGRSSPLVIHSARGPVISLNHRREWLVNANITHAFNNRRRRSTGHRILQHGDQSGSFSLQGYWSASTGQSVHHRSSRLYVRQSIWKSVLHQLCASRRWSRH